MSSFLSCCCSAGVEHFLGKEEVSGSNPDISSEVAVNELTAFLFYIIIVQIVIIIMFLIYQVSPFDVIF